ncbi:MAG: hypothetical protein KAR32_12905 [Candidatus Omnitrophica bacterium]|nr:hypothetical protein [Candidatus Omnitrophota bacterium]
MVVHRSRAQEQKGARAQGRTSVKAKRRKRAVAPVARPVRYEDHYQMALYVSIASVCIFFIAFRAINVSVERQLKIQLPEKQAPVSTVLPLESIAVEQVKKTATVNRNSSDPEEYNIRAQERDLLFSNQYRWNSVMKSAVKESDIIERMSDGDAFKGIKKTPEQFRDQLERIEGRICEYEQKVHADPGDDHARQKLQGLYMLKATVKGLKKAVVEK